MKTTLELPDELVRRVKMRALQTDSKLKDMVAALAAGWATPRYPAGKATNGSTQATPRG